VRLIELFEQRRIGPTHGSVSSSIPLRKPSGPQWTESELETELVEQLDFSSRVHDIVTQPGIRYEVGGRSRLYTPDVFVELWPDRSGGWSYFLIEVKRAAEVEKWRAENGAKIVAATDWCGRNRSQFRIMTEKEIRTPHLRNARRLSTLVGHLPDDWALAAIRSSIDAGSTKASAIIEELVASDHDEAEVRDQLDRAVVNRFLRCDLALPYDDDAVVTRSDTHGHEYNDRDPIIRLLMGADSR
jgi:hypothetical protein